MSDARPAVPTPLSPSAGRPCWCGNAVLQEFSDHYRHCENCGTLVSTVVHDVDVSRVQRDSSDLYGRDYWFGHMEEDLGFANIYQRARTDLTERAPHWLKTVLKFTAPQARVLELGSAHGGFVALLRWAGFDATGLELSPAIAQIARDLFHVPMLQGPVEDQDLSRGSLDVIALMDVLEHLPDPAQTMRHCVSLLKPGGFLLVQTPKYPEGKTLAMLEADHDRFVEQLKSDEHLYLFSARSVTRLFAELGLGHVLFEPAFFSHYDMFFVASRTPLEARDPAEQEARVMSAGAGRLIVALLELYDQVQRSVSRQVFEESEADRTARLEVIERQGRALGESEHQLASHRARAEALDAALQTAEADRAARLEVIHRQAEELATAAATLDRQQAELAASVARLAEIERGRDAWQARAVTAERLAARSILAQIADRLRGRRLEPPK